MIHKAPKDNFWALPGGRFQFNEPTNQTVKREMLEELDINVDVKKLRWIAENFFDFNGKFYHELGVYFLIPAINMSLFSSKGIETDKDLIFRWQEIEALKDIKLHPKFLQSSLQFLPECTEYIVNYG